MKPNSLQKPDSPVQLFLRIKHPSLDPREISSAIGMEPEHSVRAGESISAKGKSRLHSESYWIAPLPNVTFPISVAAETSRDYRSLVSTSSAQATASNQMRHFERGAYALQGLSRDEVLATIGASPIELLIAPWLRKLAAQGEFLRFLNADGGTVTLLVQLRNVDHPLRVRPSLARRLADVGIELEVDWS